jgi:hypothetical protein
LNCVYNGAVVVVASAHKRVWFVRDKLAGRAFYALYLSDGRLKCE